MMRALSTLTAAAACPPTDERREFFIAGEPIEQMSDAAEVAVAGEIVLSGFATKLLLSKLGVDPSSGSSINGVGARGGDSMRESSISSHPPLAAEASLFRAERSEASAFSRLAFWRRDLRTAEDRLDAKLRAGRPNERGMWVIRVTEAGVRHPSDWGGVSSLLAGVVGRSGGGRRSTGSRSSSLARASVGYNVQAGFSGSGGRWQVAARWQRWRRRRRR